MTARGYICMLLIISLCSEADSQSRKDVVNTLNAAKAAKGTFFFSNFFSLDDEAIPYAVL